MMRVTNWRWWRENIQPTVLVVFLVLAGGVWGFASLTDEVLENETKSFDTTILMAMRHVDDVSKTWGPAYLKEMARDITALGSYTLLSATVLSVVICLFLLRNSFTGLYVFGAFMGGSLMTNLLKYIFDRPRPDLVPHLTSVSTASFPSGHTTMTAVTFLTLGAILVETVDRKRVKTFILTLAMVVTIAVGVSRVYLGVHWPTDVLAGWCIGSAWAMLCWLVAQLWKRRLHTGNDSRHTPGD